ncbi:MAG: hypothetical protein M5U26_01025 [Planctomycetota bacterium]|nr:hypothetical protein [Planctomycetota bacterium]
MADEFTRLEALRELARQLEMDQARVLRGEKRKVGVLIFMLVFVVGYMSWIYWSVSQLDAKLLTNHAGIFIENQLPAWRRELETRTLEQAPGLADKVQQLVLDLPRTVRTRTEAELMAHSRAALTDMENTLNAQMKDRVRQIVVELGKNAQVDLDSKEKLDLVISRSQAEFKTKVIAYLDANYDDFAKQLAILNQRLMSLLRPADELNSRERLQREIVESTIVLVTKYYRLEKDHIFKNPFPSLRAAQESGLLKD